MGRVVSLAAVILSAAPAPGPETFRNVADAARPTLVRLVCGSGRTGSGVIVGGQGQLLAPASACSTDVVVVVRADGTSANARRLRASKELGVMLLQLPEGTYPAAPIGRARNLTKGAWIVGVGLGEHGPQAVPAQISARDEHKTLADRPMLPGAGIFALDGSLVGLAPSYGPNHQMKVIGVDALKAWLDGTEATP